MRASARVQAEQDPAPEAPLDLTGSSVARLAALDGLRGIAASGVVLLHTFGFYLFWMWSFVDLFFVLSGFLITGIVLRSERGLRSLRNFWMRRVLRIWPVYYLSLGGAVVAFAAGRAAGSAWASHPAPDLWPYALFVQFYEAYLGDMNLLGANPMRSFFHSWSVAIEEQFYVVWPLLIWLLRGQPRALLAACAVALAATVTLRFCGWPAHVLITRCDGLLLGSALAVAQVYGLGGARARARVLAAMVVAGMLLVLPYVANGYLQRFGLDELRRANDLSAEILGFALLYCGIVACTVWGFWPAASRLLTWKPFVYLGSISYAVYMFHVPVMVAVNAAFSPSHRVQGVLTIVLTLVLAELSRRYFESRFSRYKDAFPMVPALRGPAAASV